MLAFFRLVRLPNLLIMAFAMIMMRFFLVKPVLDMLNCGQSTDFFRHQLSPLHFWMLVLSVVLIGAAGYIINDYFDVRIDQVNRPETNVIDRGIKRRWAIVLHTIFNVTAVLLGVWVSWKNHLLTLGLMLFIGAPTLLWFYSTDFKKRILIGNVVIALLTGMVPLLEALFEVRGLNIAYGDFVSQSLADFSLIIRLSSYFALFAFVISLVREIIKDTEDYEGDMKYGCRTFPIAFGIAPTKWLITGLIVALIALIGLFESRLFLADANDYDMKSLSWFLLLVQLPLAFLAWRVMKATGKKDYRFASLLTKLIMLAGAAYFFLFSGILSELCSQIS